MTNQNGQASHRPTPGVRIRIDETNPTDPAELPSHSGRRIVIGAALALVLLGGTLQVAFRLWRTGYRKRAAFGAAEVAPAIDPLADVVPPGVDAAAWRQAVAETHDALVTLTAANLLDLTQMQSLRDDLRNRVALARPETARAELARLWNELGEQAGPILYVRHPRPKLLPAAPASARRRPRPGG